MKNIIFIAPPAAGKGTMSELLIEKYGYIHISTGDILRGIAKSGTEFGNKLANLLSEGKLISDDIVYEAVRERLRMPDLDNGYILEKRITGRRLCENCGATYNVLTGVNTPKTDGKCDKCGGNLYQRSDDNSESFKVRYDEFIEKTYPLVEYYKKNNALVSIDSVDPDETIKAIEGVIND